jgi:hypothetical protein
MDTLITVTRDKKAGRSSAVIDKQRDGPERPLLSFRLKVIEVGTDEDDEPVTSCVIDPEDTETIKKLHKLSNKSL